MRSLFILVLALCGVSALPANQEVGSCLRDKLYTLLSKSGTEFCSSVVDKHCHTVSTPTQYATYHPGQVTSACKCIFTDNCTQSATKSRDSGPEPAQTSIDSGAQNPARSADPSKGTHKGKANETSARVSVIVVTKTNWKTRSRTSTTARSSSKASDANSKTSGASDPRSTSDDSPYPAPSSGSQSGTSNNSTSTLNPATSVNSGSQSESPTSGNVVRTETIGATVTATSSIIAPPSPSNNSTSVNNSAASSNPAGSSQRSASDGDGGIRTETVGVTITATTSAGAQPTPPDGSTSINNNTASSSSGGQNESPASNGDGGVRTETIGVTVTATSSLGGQPTPPNDSASVYNSAASTNSSGQAESSTSGGDGGVITETIGLTLTATSSGGDDFTTKIGTSGTQTPGNNGPNPSGNPTTLVGAPAPGPSTIPGGIATTLTAFNSTGEAPAPTFTLPAGRNTSAPGVPSGTTPTAIQTSLPVANFTQVTRTAALSKETCYHLNRGGEEGSRRALLHNTDLREHNATIPFPYVESVDFQSDGVDPLFMTLRDAAEGTHYIDISNRSHIAIIDSLNNVMLLDATGIHFSTNSCRYDVSITIDGMYQQLAVLSRETCATGGAKRKRLDDMDFTQTLYLHDQCNNPVDRTIRKYPSLRVGDTDCNDIEVDAKTGKWVFDCTFPGSDSGSLKCQTAVKNDIVNFLFVDPFGGACPDLSTVITTLEAAGQDFINPASLRAELYNQGLNEAQRAEVDQTVVYYEQLWELLKQAFSKSRTRPPGIASAIEEYIDIYNSLRNFRNDICDDLHAGDMPLKMNLAAGVTRVASVATLNWAPKNPAPFNITVQDQSKKACCAKGTVSSSDQASNTCAYPISALISGTGCVCGKTVSGSAVAFQYTECDNFVGTCKTDSDCVDAGNPSFVCLTGSCCGRGVCIDPYECAQNGTDLVGMGIEVR